MTACLKCKKTDDSDCDSSSATTKVRGEWFSLELNEGKDLCAQCALDMVKVLKEWLGEKK